MMLLRGGSAQHRKSRKEKRRREGAQAETDGAPLTHGLNLQVHISISCVLPDQTDRQQSKTIEKKEKRAPEHVGHIRKSNNSLSIQSNPRTE